MNKIRKVALISGITGQNGSFLVEFLIEKGYEVHGVETDAISILRMQEAVRILGMEKKTRIYQASTSKLFGLVQEIPQKEPASFYPRSPHDVAKEYGLGIIKNYRDGTGKKISIREVAGMIMMEIGVKGELLWDGSKPDDTICKQTDVSKLHSLGWYHKVEIDEGIERFYKWYLKGV